jgi:hypothetical protein
MDRRLSLVSSFSGKFVAAHFRTFATLSALIRHQRVADERPRLGSKADVMFDPGRLGLNGIKGCGGSTGGTPVALYLAALYNRPSGVAAAL